MASRSQHYVAAEKLLAEGEEVMARLRQCASEREAITASRPDEDLGAWARTTGDRMHRLTQRMDEYSKKAMGIWAQAQVHATLATASNWVAELLSERAAEGEGE